MTSCPPLRATSRRCPDLIILISDFVIEMMAVANAGARPSSFPASSKQKQYTGWGVCSEGLVLALLSTLFTSVQSVSHSLFSLLQLAIIRPLTGFSISTVPTQRVSRMEGPTHYRPSGGPINGASPKFVRFPRISNEGVPSTQETSSATLRQAHRSFFDIFSSLRSNRQGRSILIKSSDPIVSEKKLPLKPIIHRQSAAAGMDSHVEASPYMWPHDSSFDRKTTALVIIDMQRDCKLGFLLFRGAHLISQPSEPTIS